MRNQTEKDQLKNDNVLLYFFEGIACIFVIFIHCQPPGPIGQAVAAMARFAVPMFFIVTGVFLFPKEIDDDMEVKRLHHRLYKKIKKQILTFMISYVIYEIILIIRSMILYEKMPFAGERFCINNIISILLLNQGPIIMNEYHLWFLLSLIQIYLIVLVFGRKIYLYHKQLMALWICLFLFFEFYFSDKVFPIGSFELHGSYLIYNGWMEGLTFVLIGINLKFLNKKKFISPKLLILSLPILFITSILERFIFGIKIDVYISSILIAVITVLLSYMVDLSNTSNTCRSAKLFEKIGRVVKLFEKVGKSLSTDIYIIHLLIVKLLEIKNEGIWLWFKPFVTVMISICVSVIYEKLKRHMALKIA